MVMIVCDFLFSSLLTRLEKIRHTSLSALFNPILDERMLDKGNERLQPGIQPGTKYINRPSPLSLNLKMMNNKTRNKIAEKLLKDQRKLRHLAYI